MQQIILKDEDRLILNGLDDNCFMIVRSIEIGELVDIPIFFRGDVFQIDTGNSAVYKIGEKIIQASIKINTMWEEEQFEIRQD